MTEKKTPTVKEPKDKVVSKVKIETAPKTAKVESKAKTATAKSITVKQIGSPQRREAVQREYLKGLGLRKMNDVRTLQDTPGVRGLLVKAAHMIEVTEG